MKLSEEIRKHALGRIGCHTFDCIESDDVFRAVREFCRGSLEQSDELKPEERRMFCLFAAEAWAEIEERYLPNRRFATGAEG